ncbi:MAG: M20/M25/M40 family metallo-hydrolase [Candidatus Cloacimonetes bacterium]|nr:M20/M25/M40 family metallo-hydrolase [Candidatus Cloacimonadota bacterium]
MDRLVEYFISLVEIDSESKNEKRVAEKIANDLSEMGAEVIFDHAHHATQGNVGNLIANFKGKINKTPLLLCAHTDTVKPGIGVKAIIEDGYIRTDGSTILGSDDKAGIAQIVEAIRRLDEEGVEHAPIQVLFTISEEIGLLGAKNLDYSLIDAKVGFALDWHGVCSIVTHAPSLNIFEIVVTGKEAHAGGSPEKGINAIQVTGEAIGKLKLGRIDFETTANIGNIKGGLAHNIVPKECFVSGEVRSHDEVKLEKITQEIITTFKDVASKYEVEVDSEVIKAHAHAHVLNDFAALKISEEEEIVKIAENAARNLGLEPAIETGGGGSDANVFAKHGLIVPIIGTGMNDVHSTHENIKIEDLENVTRWVVEIIKEYSKK